MRKVLNVVLLILSIFLCLPSNAFALDTSVIGKQGISDAVNVRVGPSAVTDLALSYSIPTGTYVTILDVVAENPVTTACTSDIWYKVNYDNTDGYVCSNFLTLVGGNAGSGSSVDKSYDFETELAKFPESYKSNLRSLHEAHPAWKYYASDTGLSWKDAVDNEAESSKCLVQIGKPENYGWIWQDLYAYEDWTIDKPRNFDSGNWYIANRQVVEYNMDPRSYLTNEIDIFAFLSNRFMNQTESGVSAILSGTFMSSGFGGIYTGSFDLNDSAIAAINSRNGNYDKNSNTKTFSSSFYDAGVIYGISPYLLASRSRNEVCSGGYPSQSVTGTVGGYTGYYNFFNIGAVAASGKSAIENGLIRARDKGWNNPYLSILGGADLLLNGYIKYGQDNLYYQKFNTITYKFTNGDNAHQNFSNQYMTNVEAVFTDARSTYKAYSNLGVLDQALVFNIPVYSGDMPQTSNYPISPAAGSGNPNNYLTDIKINGVTLTNYDGAYINDYNINVDYDVNSINISVSKPINWKTGNEVPSNVSGIGTIILSQTEGIEKPIKHDIVVTAQNGSTRTYTINITRNPEPPKDDKGEIVYPSIDDIVDKLSIRYDNNYMSGYDYGTMYTSFDELFNKNINTTLVNYKVQPNSNNGSGHFATGDIILIKSGEQTKEYKYVLYGDLNGDGEINLSDLVNCRKILLGTSNLTDSNYKAADVNRDGSVNLSDLVLIRKHLLGTSLTQR